MTSATLHGSTALGLAVLIAATATPACAQDQQDVPATSVTVGAQAEERASTDQADRDIIVTASRREESLSRVGATVSVIGAEALVTQGVKNAADLTRFVPGFQATQSYNGNPVYTLRGVGFNSPNANATPPVGLYLDEAAIAYPYMTLGLVYDLERVEVLKGPQGTLYGRNATGGLVNFIAAKPTNEAAGGMTFEVGNYRTVNATGFVGGPLGGGLRGRFAFSTQNRNQGFQRSVTRDERLGELHQHSLRAIIDNGNDGPFTFSLTGNYWNRSGDTMAPQSIRYLPGAAGNPLARESVIANPTSNTQADWASQGRQTQRDIGITWPGPLMDSEFWSGSLKLGYDVTDGVQIASLTAYQHLRHRDVADLGGFQTISNAQDVTGRITSFSQELRLLGSSDALNWSIGGYYAKDTSRQKQVGYNDENFVISRLRGAAQAINLGLIPTPSPVGRYTSAQIARSFGNYESRSTGENEVLSGFANADLRLSNQLKVTLGARYTEDKQRQSACTYDYRGTNVAVVNLYYGLVFGKLVDLQPGQCYTLQAGTGNFVNGAVNSRQKQTNFAWKANVDWTPSDTTLLYASISRGYKAGGFPLIAASASNQFDPIQQEELTSYEVGTKIGLLNRAVQVNVSGFYYDYKNKQIFGRVQDLVFSTLSRIDNIPESHEYGVEGDATFRISSALRFNVAAVYLKSKIDRYETFDQFGTFRNLAGRPYSYTPEFQGNALLTLDQPISDTIKITGSASASYQGKSSASVADLPDFRIDDYALVGATLGVAAPDDSWSVQAYVTNLFDTYYWNGVESATDSVFRFAGLPRMGGVRASFRF